jgi:spoIIIJ-associated protein
MNEQTTTLDSQALILIEEHVRRLLSIMSFEGATVRCQFANETLSVAIEAGEDGRILIGPQGRHIAALQHVVRCILRSQLQEAVRVSVDVNSYRLRREESLLHLAQESARKATRTGRTIVMRPMSASDRRAIHSALANQKDIHTESLGDEPNRRVIIRPVFL